MIKDSYLKELQLETTLRRGSKGEKVKSVQEWLNLWRYVDPHWNMHLGFDGDYGPITERIVSQFQQRHNLLADGIVGKQTYSKLTEPMQQAFSPLHIFNPVLSDYVIAYANQHLNSNPKELLNDNLGPWVRAYMDGKEGSDWYWCMGFAQTIYDQAFSSLSKQFTHYMKRSFSCDVVGNDAKSRNQLITNAELPQRLNEVQKGDMFLREKSPGDWTHTGIIISISDQVFETIEGNTNDEGSRNGYEVCRRYRNFTKEKLDVFMIRI